MAFQGAGFDIIIDAVLTEVGKKRMAEGNFRIAKFSLGDDEIDYNRFDLESDEEEGFTQSLLTQSCMEAGSTNGANILYGLQTFKRQDLLHFPVLKVNKASQIDTNPTLTPGLMSDAIHTTASAYYLSANEETSQKIDQIFSTGSFKYLTSDDFTKNKIIIESGISERMEVPDWFNMPPDASQEDYKTDEQGRIYQIISKGLYDKNYFIFCDKRFFKNVIVSDPCGSSFKNYADGSADINFIASKIINKISYGFIYDNFECFSAEGVPNLISDHGKPYDGVNPPLNKRFSELGGPKGSAVAFNLRVDEELRTQSTGERDYRYTKMGKTDQYVFDKTHKFDYIDTNIYVEGVSSRKSTVVPIRLIRYSGT